MRVKLLGVILLVLSITLSFSYELTEDLAFFKRLLDCEQTCRAQRRDSLCSTESQCGGCIQSHMARDGVCFPVTDDLPSEEAKIDEARAFQEQQQQQREREDEHVKVSKKSSDVVEKQVNADASDNTQEVRSESTSDSDTHLNTIVFIAVVTGCSIAGVVGLIVAAVCWYRLQKNVKAASDVDYPAYGVTGPTKERLSSPSDRKLAQSAQMYHYQHQKQQMIAMEKAQGDLNKDGSDADSEEENEEGDYTVFECPGLAPTGEMEVKNPLFSEDTPVTPAGDNQQHK